MFVSFPQLHGPEVWPRFQRLALALLPSLGSQRAFKWGRRGPCWELTNVLGIWSQNVVIIEAATECRTCF